MSTKTQNTTPAADVTTLPIAESVSTPAEKRPNVLVRGYRSIKQTPPKTALAVLGGVALVGLGAALGRQTGNVFVVLDNTDPIEDDDYAVDEIVPSSEDTVA